MTTSHNCAPGSSIHSRHCPGQGTALLFQAMFRPAVLAALLLIGTLPAPAIADGHQLHTGNNTSNRDCGPYGNESEICWPTADNVPDPFPQPSDPSPRQQPNGVGGYLSRFWETITEFRLPTFAEPSYTYEY